MGTPEFIYCDVATSDAERRQRLEIVTNRYLQAGYIRPDDPQIIEGVYQDKYEVISTPFVAKINNQVIASLRLIPNTPEAGLPINRAREIIIHPEWKSRISTIPLEVSQLAKANRYYRDNRPTLALFRAYVVYSRKSGFNEAGAVVDSSLITLLNSPAIGFGLPKVGPAVDYLGSSSVPVYINIDNAIQNTREAGNHYLADFFDSGKATRFDWYRGT